MTDLTNDQHADTTVVAEAPENKQRATTEAARKAILQYDASKAIADTGQHADKGTSKIVSRIGVPYSDGLLDAIIRLFNSKTATPVTDPEKNMKYNGVSISHNGEYASELKIPKDLLDEFKAAQQKFREGLAR